MTARHTIGVLTLVALASAAPARQEALLLRLKLRPGDAWRERVVHEVEVLSESGDVVRASRSERTEAVEVLALEEPGGARGGRWVRLRRTPDPAPAAGASGEQTSEAEEPQSAPTPYEVLVSTRGEIALPPPTADAPALPPGRDPLLASLVSRSAPVLPEKALAVGGTGERVLATSFGSGGGFVETERATLARVERAPGGDVAVVAFERRAELPQRVPLMDDALAAPVQGALVPNVRSRPIELDVRGASGEGEMRIDPVRRALLSWSMRETFGLSARLGGSSAERTVFVRREIERIE